MCMRSRLILPFLQGYVMSGEFDFKAKCLDSLKINLIFYAASLLVLLVFVILLITQTALNTLYGVN